MAARRGPLPCRPSGIFPGKAGETYNIGGGQEQDNLTVTELLLELCGANHSMIHHVADRKGHDRRYSIDDSKIREELGYVPHIGFDEGLRGTVDWYRNNADWWKAANYEKLTWPGSYNSRRQLSGVSLRACFIFPNTRLVCSAVSGPM